MLEWQDLNARHEAAILWLSAMLVVATATSSDVRRSVHDLLRMLLRPVILLPIVGLLANVGIITTITVLVGRKVGLWETFPVVTAIVWAFTAGFSLLLDLGDSLKGDNTFGKRVIRLLGPSTIVAEIVGVSILAFWLEILIVPVLVGLASVVHANRNTGATVISSALLLMYAGGLIFGVITVLVDDPGTWRSPTQAVLFPIVLTIGTLPYIQLLVLAERLKFRRGAKCKTVRSSDYGKDWPLTVDLAKLCSRFQAVWIEVDGKKYWLNGIAEPILKKYGYASLELKDIWKDHPDKWKLAEASGTHREDVEWKVSIHRLIQDGLALEGQ